MADHDRQVPKRPETLIAIPLPSLVAHHNIKQEDRGEAHSIESPELPSELRGLSLLSALDLDPRPTFIIELGETQSDGRDVKKSKLVFRNSALNSCPALCDAIKAPEWKESFAWQHRFSLGDHSGGGGDESSLAMFGCLWEFYTINGIWRVASTTLRAKSQLATIVPSFCEPPDTNNIQSLRPDRAETEQERDNSKLKTESILKQESPLSQLSFAEITSAFRDNTTPALSTEFGQLLYRFDWAATHLGPMYTWSQQLLEMFKLMLTDPRPAMLFWGPHNVMLYNEAVVPLMVGRHPGSIGLTVEMIYKDVWEDLHKPLIAQILRTAEAQTHVNTLLCYPKENDFLEEVYADYTSIPVIGNDGCVVGVYQSIVVVTEKTLTQRRTHTLSALATIAAESRDLKSIWGNILAGLQLNDNDIPQLLLYSLDAKWGETTTNSKCKLEGSIRWTSKSELGFETFDLSDQDHVLSKLFQRSTTAEVPLYFDQRQAKPLGEELTSDSSSRLPDFVNSFELGSFGDPCHNMVIFPIRANIADEPIGFVIWGLNSRQPYNQAYRDFVRFIQQALAALISSGLRWEEELLSSQYAAEKAEMNNASLSAQLLQRIEEAEANELRFTRFIQYGPIGICIYAPDGSMAFANEQWYIMTEFPRDGNSTGASWWMPMVFEEDRTYATGMFTRLMIEKQPVHFEIRLTATPKQFSMAEKISTWTLVSAYPELSKTNDLEAIVACFTDITEQKWAAEVERIRTEDAIEAKRQQEAFVDITSHEIRNPLSAVLQCAQEISNICQEKLKTETEGVSRLYIHRQDLKDALYAAEIIEQCTVHQKRIVDDILTLSKMDAGLLPVIATPAQPVTIVEKTLNIFRRPLLEAATEVNFVIDDSYTELNLDWLELDTGRLSQMLINLTTNAIKFTKHQPKRQIEFRMGASSGSTRLKTWHLDYLPPSTYKIQTVGFDWPQEDCVYLHISVSDTGTGMTLDEQKSLFIRFSQGSARTYTQYGGSGLGLYICRALVELHGGQIGFSSMAGVGSTFGFFIRTRRLSTANVPKNLSTNALSSGAVSIESPLDIMLVEDNLVNQKVLCRQLSRLGHSVTVANHGQECLEFLQRSHFCQESGSNLSIILMDIEMPVMDGITCATEIRAMEAGGLIHSHVPIIAITGNARDEKVQEALDAGMDKVVLKPFTLPILMPLIFNLVQKYEI